MTNNSQKKVKKVNIFLFVFFILSFVICVLCANLFSSVITASSLSIIKNAKSLSFNVYLLYTESFQSEHEAQQNTQICTESNGAGYIFCIDSLYYVCHSAYEEENDAKKVIENCSDLTLHTKKLELKNISTENSVLFDNIKLFYNCFCKLFDISVCLDSNAYSEAVGYNNLCDAINDANTIKSNLNKVDTDSSSQIIMQTKLKTTDLINCLDSCKQSYLSSKNQSSLLKNTYLQILELRLTLEKSI